MPQNCSETNPYLVLAAIRYTCKEIDFKTIPQIVVPAFHRFCSEKLSDILGQYQNVFQPQLFFPT